MKKNLLSLLAVCCLFCLPNTIFAAAPSLKDIQVTQRLKLVDDRGNNLVLHNARQFRLKWSIQDPSPYQHFQAYTGSNGLVYFIAFDYLMAVDTQGNIKWKQSLPSELNTFELIGDDAYYRFYQGNLEYADETSLIIDQIVRVDEDGRKIIIPATTLYAPKNEQGFSLDYPVYSADDYGNLILLAGTGQGLTLYHPDGSVAWQRETVEDRDRKLSVYEFLNLFSDESGNIYAQTKDRLLKLDGQGNVLWSKSLPGPGIFYMAQRGKLVSWTFDAATMSPHYTTYSISEKDGSLVPDPVSGVTNRGIGDLRGGTYELDEKTNTVLNRDKSGKIKWKYSLTKKDIAWGRSLAAFTMTGDTAGNVYFSANVGTVYSLDPSGKPRFIVEMNNKHSYFSRILSISDKLTIIMIDNQILAIEKIK
ncbi:PQQ-binding-like beta-propeller repeat protein [Cohnella herbarum]|uniref:PQQ-binding-like beta-propeller repeat protein n=1 Tax=Cohnella herbarum TaxID=2728023 RepID=A0A7Z2VK24_9BACL|nr:PQQ-binding-like beta-propeller repeat protein [Cohnella herbarum]QJD84451.1 PQQ-binding-like beta-propeller repeat protein [Cohnella herbarum]